MGWIVMVYLAIGAVVCVDSLMACREQIGDADPVNLFMAMMAIMFGWPALMFPPKPHDGERR